MNSLSVVSGSPSRTKLTLFTVLVAALLAVVGIWTQEKLGDRLLPHAFCINASRPLLLLHLISDGLIALSYLLIPWAMVAFVRRRKDMPFGWVAWVFGAFIVACGITHAFQMWTLWYPVYWYAGVAKAFTALVSLGTAWLIYRLAPLALALPSARQLSDANEALRTEVAARKQAEMDLARAKGEVEELLTLSEERAQTRESQFYALAENISQLAWMTDASGSIYWYNKRWFEYTGTTLEQVRGWGWKSVHHPDHVTRVEAKFRAHIESGEPWEDTFPLRRRDGEYRWFLSRAVPLRDASGEIAGWVGTNTDITDQREAQEALREADRRKDEFIATLAHELRNPLAPVQNAAEVLSRSQHDDPRVERMTATIKRQVTHMGRLLDDLLDVARISRGKLHLRREQCDLARIVASTAEDYRPSLTSAGIALTVDVGEAPLLVLGDPIRLAQMTANYLQNATRFAPNAEVRVEVRAEFDSGNAVVRVSDTGSGISKDLLPKLFSTFTQEEQGLARTTGGLGLGLALTKGLAHLHGGSVSVSSPGPGQGATFEFRVPLDVDERTPMQRAVADATRARPLKVLVVEDNADAAETLQALLELEGHRVRLAFDGRAGIESARTWKPDLVLCDLGLPGTVDGFAVASALKSDPATHHVKLIALTGYADDLSREAARSRGFDEHLAKPVGFEQLKECLGRFEGMIARARG